jgi:hypothetical protein
VGKKPNERWREVANKVNGMKARGCRLTPAHGKESPTLRAKKGSAKDLPGARLIDFVIHCDNFM